MMLAPVLTPHGLLMLVQSLEAEGEAPALEPEHGLRLEKALKLPFHALHRRSQPTLDVEQDPGFLTVLAQSRHQEAVIEIVEQPSDVELHNPVIVPAATSGNGDCLQRRLSWTITVGVIAEDRIKPWLQPHLHRRLRDPVGYRRDAQYPDAS